MSERYLNLIKESTLLSALSLSEIRRFLKKGQFQVAHYVAHSVVHFDGELCNKLDIILSGTMVVERIEESGNLLTVAEFHHNDILGGNLIFSSNPYYPMTITARSSSAVLEIDRSLLFELLCSNKILLKAYLEFVSDHASLLGDKIKHYMNKTIRESVISFLRHEYKRQNTCKIKLNMTKKALAERIGVQRTSLSRELKKMQNDGLIVFDSKSITILNLNLL